MGSDVNGLYGELSQSPIQFVFLTPNSSIRLAISRKRKPESDAIGDSWWPFRASKHVDTPTSIRHYDTVLERHTRVKAKL